VNNLPKVVTRQRNGPESNRRIADRETNVLTIAPAGLDGSSSGQYFDVFVREYFRKPLSSTVLFASVAKCT